MGFFRRHSKLESLALIGCMDDRFSNDIEPGFLPNLKHLKARFVDIRILAPILPQLVSLSFVESYNGQVPYFIRAVIPNGLRQLKSLEIEQTIAGWEFRQREGIQWYETLDGDFRIEKARKKIPRNFMNGYMHSIVRGMPNLEEQGLNGMTLFSEALRVLRPTLSQLSKMVRFYYRAFLLDPKYRMPPPPECHEEMLADFLSSTKTLAGVCDITGVKRSDGVGMLTSAHEDNPFPSNT